MSNKNGLLTPKQIQFVACWQGDAVAAARSAGYSSPEQEGSRLMSNPAVKQAIEDKQAAIVHAAGTEIGKAIGEAITKDMIASRAWAIANTDADKLGMFTSQVNALKFLSELMGYAGNKEGELKHGVIQRPDGGVEVYQSQWVKRSEHSSPSL